VLLLGVGVCCEPVWLGEGEPDAGVISGNVFRHPVNETNATSAIATNPSRAVFRLMAATLPPSAHMWFELLGTLGEFDRVVRICVLKCGIQIASYLRQMECELGESLDAQYSGTGDEVEGMSAK
jgi:hypothetical protein